MVRSTRPPSDAMRGFLWTVDLICPRHLLNISRNTIFLSVSETCLGFSHDLKLLISNDILPCQM